jgi:signal transduction histidine kinase/DNA-binding response OmpR family regulator
VRGTGLVVVGWVGAECVGGRFLAFWLLFFCLFLFAFLWNILKNGGIIKEISLGICEKGGKWMKIIYRNPLLKDHKDLVNQDNCVIEQVFELMLLFCSLALLMVSFFMNEYGSMRNAYLLYVIVSLAFFVFTRYYVSRHLQYVPVMLILVLLESYSYCIFSGIIYNVDSPSVTVYALMVAACSAFMVSFSFTAIFHSIAAVIYCGLAIAMKPEHGMGDTVNYVFFLVMSFVLTSIVYKIRLAYLESVDEAVEQKLIAEENVKLERKLRISEQASQAKTKFLSRVSHEIRTPINGIIGIAELERQDVRADDMNKERFMEYINETTSAANYLLSLVNDILDSSKIDSDKIEIQQYPINVETHWITIGTLAKPLAETRNIHFSMEQLSKFNRNYIADGVRIQQIVMNLLSNAFKFTPPGGNVRLTVEMIEESPETTTLQFVVTDDGIGMSEEFQKNLFRQFAQEQDSNTSEFTGSGLGLYISKELANLMGGDIVCHSKKGAGTTFVATLVIGNIADSEEADIESKEKPENVEMSDFGGIHILLCEDHPLNQRITKAMLERKNCTVEIAEDGVIGVDMFEKSQVGYYALVLMDIRMPNMDGLDATRTIRALKRADASTVPIIAMSANTYAEDVQKSLDAGMNEHLAKPVEAGKLYQTIAVYTHIGTPETPEQKDTVLLVDDIEMNRAMVAKALRIDYDVLFAENGVQALEVLEANSDIIAVITDIQMPVMDGIELVREIRKKIEYDNVAILANTQFGDEKQEHLLVKLGADDFVYKPITPTLLSVRLKNVLARRQQIQ